MSWIIWTDRKSQLKKNLEPVFGLTNVSVWYGPRAWFDSTGAMQVLKRKIINYTAKRFILPEYHVQIVFAKAKYCWWPGNKFKWWYPLVKSQTNIKSPLWTYSNITLQSYNLNFCFQINWFVYPRSKINRFLPEAFSDTERGLTGWEEKRTLYHGHYLKDLKLSLPYKFRII